MASNPHRWRILAVVATAFFMTILDVSIVNVALPSIAKDLDFSQENLQWVITAYAITFGGFLLLGGRAADLLGRRRVFIVGVALFTIASLVCGLAQSEGMLIASRAVQGLGGAIISPAALSIVMTSFEEGRRAQQGARRLGCARRQRRRGRRARGRRADGLPQLALDLLRQRARRRARAAADAADRSREPPRGRGSGATTRSAPCSSARASRCSSTRSREAPNVGWGTARTILLLIVGDRTARRLPRQRAPRPRSVDAVPHLPRAHGCRRERRRLLARSRDLRELLPADAVRAGRPRLLAAEDRPHVHRDRRHGRPRGRRGAGADDEVRREADHRHRAHAADRGDDLVLADPGAREVRRRIFCPAT